MNEENTPHDGSDADGGPASDPAADPQLEPATEDAAASRPSATTGTDQSADPAAAPQEEPAARPESSSAEGSTTGQEPAAASGGVRRTRRVISRRTVEEDISETITEDLPAAYRLPSSAYPTTVG